MKKITSITAVFILSFELNAQVINEGFESGACPPTGWTADNPDAGTTWAATAVAAKTGTYCMFMDTYNYATQGEVDAVISSPIDLTAATAPATLTFQLAYQMYSDPNTYTTSDQLNIYVSTDGGSTWNSVYAKSHLSLVTATPQFDSLNMFVPKPSDWRLETVDLSAYSTATNAMIKFECVNDYENNMYIDDIMIAGSAVSVSNLNLEKHVDVYPNPSQGNINIAVNLLDLGKTTVTVSNAVGETVLKTTQTLTNPATLKYDIGNQPDGVYFIKMESAIGISVKKISLNK